MTAETASPPEPQSLDAGTEYAVFQKVLATEDRTKLLWEQLSTTNARTPNAALEFVVGNLPEAQRKGTFVAVALKYWQPKPVSEKVERTLVIGT